MWVDHGSFPSEVIYQHPALPVDAFQLVVVLPLDAFFADDVALVIACIGRQVEFAFTNLAYVAHQVGGEAILHGYSRRHDPIMSISGNVASRCDWMKAISSAVSSLLMIDLRLAAFSAEKGRQIVVIQMQCLGNCRKVLPLDLIPVQDQRVGSLVVDHHAAIAVEKLAARRQDRRRLDAVPRRRFHVDVRILYSLKLPISGREKNEYGHYEVLKAGNFPGYGFRAIPQQVIGRYLVVFGLAFV